MLERMVKGESDWHEKVNAVIDEVNDKKDEKKNYIINPDFEVNQGGYNGLDTSAMAFKYFYDMWYVRKVGASGGTFSLDAPVDPTYKTFLSEAGRRGLTLKNSGTTTSKFILGQFIDLKQIGISTSDSLWKNYFAGKTMSFGFLIGCDDYVNVSVRVYINNTELSQDQTLQSVTYNLAPGVCKKTFEFKLPNDLLNYSNLRVEFEIALDAGKGLYLANVYATEGTNGAYVPRTYFEELDLCRRYFQWYEVLQSCFNTSTTYYAYKKEHYVSMAGTPTCTLCTNIEKSATGFKLTNQGKVMLLSSAMADSTAIEPNTVLADKDCLAISFNNSATKYGIHYIAMLDCRTYL